MPAPSVLKKRTPKSKRRKVKPAKSVSWQVGEKEPKGTGAKHVPKLTELQKVFLQCKGAIEPKAKPDMSTVCAARILSNTPRANRPKNASELLAFLASRGIE